MKRGRDEYIVRGGWIGRWRGGGGGWERRKGRYTEMDG